MNTATKLTERQVATVVSAAWNTIPHPCDDQRMTTDKAMALTRDTKVYMLEGYLVRAQRGVYSTKHAPDLIADALFTVKGA